MYNRSKNYICNRTILLLFHIVAYRPVIKAFKGYCGNIRLAGPIVHGFINQNNVLLLFKYRPV